MSVQVSYSPTLYNCLNGIFCLYKPAKMGMKTVRSLLLTQISKDLNECDVRPVYQRVVIEGNYAKNIPFSVKTVPDYSDHPLVVGPRYQNKDYSLYFASYPGWLASGLTILGIGSRGCYLARKIQNANNPRTYELKGIFGKSTNDFTDQGRILEKSTYKHVTRPRLESFLNNLQSSQQSLMFETLGVDPASQEAYEIASKGLIRPINRISDTIIYGIRCIDFHLPNFTIEVNVINENILALVQLGHFIGLEMKTNACISSVRCTRYGPFTVEQALLEKHWTLENIINNIKCCETLSTIFPQSPVLSVFKQTDNSRVKESSFDEIEMPPEEDFDLEYYFDDEIM